MKDPAYFDIKESLSELKKLRSKQPALSKQKRVDCLIHIKTSKFKTRQELANHLGIHIRTQERWLVKYRAEGITALISNEPQARPSKIITPEIHDALAAKVNNSDSPFLGYWEAQQWVEETFNVSIKYHWLRKYLITHFKTKQKVPGNPIIKKMNRLSKPFLKLPNTFNNIRISLDKYSGVIPIAL